MPCRRLSLLIALLLTSGSPAPAQQMVDAATAEAQYEAAFAATLEFSEHGEPPLVMQAWGGVMMAAVVHDRARTREAGESPATAEAVTERVLKRWQRQRPGSGGPDLFRAFRIQDRAQKRAAVTALADRYPDDPLVVWQVANVLRQAGESGRAMGVTEAFLSRNPDHPGGYRMLAQAAGGNTTRLTEVYRRWADAVPGDPSLVSRWMSSDLPRQDPEATRRLLDELFARRPTGDSGLSACLAVQRRGSSAFAGPARACVARIAGDPGMPASVAERATSAMAGMAAADGDWSALLAALDALEPEARVRALIAASRRLKAPEGCADRVELLSVAAETPGDKDGFRSIASALKSCSDRPVARELYAALLRQAPADRVPGIVGAWSVKVNGVYRSELPPGTAEILERRLRVEGGAAGLFRALDVVYQMADPGDRRFDLLRRWHRQAPASFRSEPATDLARGLVRRQDPEAAVELLEGQLESGFDPDHAELLYGLYLEAAGQERAERFTADLIAGDGSSRQRSGHILAARSAGLRGDVAVARSHYLEALRGDYPPQEVAVELLNLLRWRGDVDSLEPVARRICEQVDRAGTGWRASGARPGSVTQCAADLLARSGSKETAAAVLTDPSAELPEDLESLRQLAATAQSAGQPAVAERALRRIVELDPRDENGWISLGVFLERQGRVDELEALLERSRELFSPPPSYLYRATGRALTAAGRSRRAIEVLLEARAALPDGPGGEWSRGWIDHELAPAYRGLGRQALAAGTAPPQIPAVAPPETASEAPDPAAALDGYRRASEAGDTRSMIDLARVTLTHDGSGAPCDEGLGWLTRSARAGNARAAAFLGKVLFYGRGQCVVRDPRAALEWLEAAAASHQPGAAYDFGLALLSIGGDAGRARGRSLLERAADRPDALAVETLAFLHATGVALPRDPGEARRLTEEALRLGSDGFPYLREQIGSSEVFRQLIDEGTRRLEALAAEGDPAATALLARLHLLGLATGADRKRAASLARQAAADGEATAMRVLSVAYQRGEGVEADPAESLRWQRRCAEAGDTQCMLFHGRALVRGEEIAHDTEAGIAWIRRSAEAGNWWAIAELGRLHDQGRHGLPRDPDQAASWKRRLADLGDAESAGWLIYHGYR